MWHITMRISSLVVSGTFWVVDRQMQQYFISYLSGLDAPLDNGSSKEGVVARTDRFIDLQSAARHWKLPMAWARVAALGGNFSSCEK